MQKYDLVVIGSGPAGEKAAVKAAYFGYRVAIVEKDKTLGGVSVNQGTLPSKSLKESALYLSGKYDQDLFGVNKALDHKATINDFMFRKNYVKDAEEKAIFYNLLKHQVDMYCGKASFIDEHTIQVEGIESTQIWGDNVLIATGSYPFHPANIPFDRKRVHDSDTILEINRLPSSVCVLGAGVIGCEYATIFATMGVKVYLVNRADSILPFIDQEVAETMLSQMKEQGVEFLFNNSVEAIDIPETEEQLLTLKMASGDPVHVDMFLFAAGRSGRTKELGCEKIGLKIGQRELITVDSQYRTNIPHIYAAGDVIGFPSLASTSMDQGRVAVCHMFNTQDLDSLAQIFPYGIYTIPEISSVGMTEEEAKKQGVNYYTGVANYKNLPRGKIMGIKEGFLKLVFDRDTQEILGVHIIGQQATEIIHYGMSLVENKKTLTQVIHTVFNYPTLHDLYKYACYDGLGNLRNHKIKDY